MTSDLRVSWCCSLNEILASVIVATGYARCQTAVQYFWSRHETSDRHTSSALRGYAQVKRKLNVRTRVHTNITQSLSDQWEITFISPSRLLSARRSAVQIAPSADTDVSARHEDENCKIVLQNESTPIWKCLRLSMFGCLYCFLSKHLRKWQIFFFNRLHSYAHPYVQCQHRLVGMRTRRRVPHSSTSFLSNIDIFPEGDFITVINMYKIFWMNVARGWIKDIVWLPGVWILSPLSTFSCITLFYIPVHFLVAQLV